MYYVSFYGNNMGIIREDFIKGFDALALLSTEVIPSTATKFVMKIFISTLANCI
jgi:hypothetical protein